MDPDGRLLDLDRDLITTMADIAMLRRCRAQTPSWMTLSQEDLDAMVPEGALDRRPPMPEDAVPFTLE